MDPYAEEDASKELLDFSSWTTDIIPPSDSNPATNGRYTVREEPFGTRRKLRVGFLGPGMSGLNFFKYTEEKLRNVEVVCWEKNNDIGGTVSLLLSLNTMAMIAFILC
jgi:hypothetical protein